MNNLIIFGLLILLLLAAQFSTARSVEEIIDKYLSARGGKNKLEGIKRVYMEGIIEKMGNRYTVKIINEQDKVSTIEIKNATPDQVTLINDKEDGRSFPEDSVLLDNIRAQEFAIWRTDLATAGYLVDYFSKGFHVVLLGKEFVEDCPCYKIRLTNGAGLEIIFWVDAITYLLTQSTALSIDTAQDDQKDTFILYKNYKEVDGIQFAHSFEIINTEKNTNKTPEVIFFHKILVDHFLDS